MALNFDTNLLTLYSTNVENDAAYGKKFAIITGTVAFATPDTTTLSPITDSLRISDGAGNYDIDFTDAGGMTTTLNSIVDDINGYSGLPDNIVASAVETSSGWVLQIRKTTAVNNSLTLEDHSGDPLAELGLTASTITGSGESGVIDSLRVDERSEQRLLTVIESLRAYLETLRDRDEAKMANLVLSRLAAGIGFNRIYDDVSISVTGNVKNATASENSGVDVTVGDATNQVNYEAGGDLASTITEINNQLELVHVTGTVETPTFLENQVMDIVADGTTKNIVLAADGDLAATITEINTDLGTFEVEAYDNNGHLGFRNTTGNEGTAFTLAGGTGAGKIHTAAGLTLGEYDNDITQVEAYNNNGYLGFRNTTGNEGTAFTLANGTNPGADAQILHQFGIMPEEYINEVMRMANRARDEALAYFAGKPRNQSL